MIIEVEQWAFGNGEIRQVNLPDDTVEPDAGHEHEKDNFLDTVFYFGQKPNEQGRYSVSVGDIIRLNNEKHLICALGFRQLTEQQYKNFISNSPEKRRRAEV